MTRDRDERGTMLLCVVKGVRRCWQTSDGPLGEGGLLLGHAVSVMDGWDGERRIDRRTTGVGVGQILGQAATQS
ncbi:MAG: hypothetical protein QOE62_1637 [Actinomycetota bacterium]|nr:hypothetical protein [Actinomycetota bacterium]